MRTKMISVLELSLIVVAAFVVAVVSFAAVIVFLGNGQESFVDSRDGKTYKTIKIGSKNWMAENLNYDVPDDTADVCYENSADSCERYGRLYLWETAKRACPAGWSLPSYDDWKILDSIASYGVSRGFCPAADYFLKSDTGWEKFGKSCNNNGSDKYGFSALPGGHSNGDSSFIGAGRYGVWWSATEPNFSPQTIELWLQMGIRPFVQGDAYSVGGLFLPFPDIARLHSVRCIQDDGKGGRQ